MRDNSKNCCSFLVLSPSFLHPRSHDPLSPSSSSSSACDSRATAFQTSFPSRFVFGGERLSSSAVHRFLPVSRSSSVVLKPVTSSFGGNWRVPLIPLTNFCRSGRRRLSLKLVSDGERDEQEMDSLSLFLSVCRSFRLGNFFTNYEKTQIQSIPSLTMIQISQENSQYTDLSIFRKKKKKKNKLSNRSYPPKSLGK